MLELDGSKKTAQLRVLHPQEDGSYTSTDLKLPTDVVFRLQEVQLALEDFKDALKRSWKRRVVELMTISHPSRRPILSHRDIPAFRDQEWMELEREYHQMALDKLNYTVYAANAVAPSGTRLPLYDLQEQLEAVFEESVRDISKALAKLYGQNAITSPTFEGREPSNQSTTLAVHLPLDKLDACSVCQGQKSPHVCAACAETIYCSRECQRRDWPSHKITCGKTDKIDLGMFYPFIAIVINTLHMAVERPLHPATMHTITSSPNPGKLGVTVPPDGSKAKIIQLGDLCTTTGDGRMKAWWPTAKSFRVACILYRRIEREGWLVPVLTATCFSLLSKIYTTTWIPAIQTPDDRDQRRVRLHYRGSPIVDFGIVKGSLDIPPHMVRTYIFKSGVEVPKVQDPTEHYWLYFTTLAGEDIMLDCGLNSYDHDGLIACHDYFVQELDNFDFSAPALLKNKTTKRYSPHVHKESQRFSVLRNTKLHDAIRIGTEDIQSIWAFMDEVAGRKCSDEEKYLVRAWIHRGCTAFTALLQQRSWLDWPSQPREISFDEETGDPHMKHPDTGVHDEQWRKEVSRIDRRYKRGQLTIEEVSAAFKEASARAEARQKNCKKPS